MVETAAAPRPVFDYGQGIVGDGGKCRADGVVGSHRREGVGRDRPLGNPVHQDTGNLVAGIGSDGKGLVGPGLDTDHPRREKWIPPVPAEAVMV